MTVINILDHETIDKIAAGEVVERPSSVVKELVENAIDAKATSITVEIKEGGIEFIRVTDNGSGIDMSQIEKAFMRHATSKIKDSEDLFKINSLGFRGEALSSIAAISKVEVITKTPNQLTGLLYRIEGGNEISKEEIGAPNGTTFLIRTLFYNTPVRRKFLKSSITEGNYISDLMERFALSHPDIAFQFITNNHNRFSTSGNGNLKEVIYRIYGREVVEELISINDTDENGVHIDGYLGKPIITRANRNFETFFVNGRYIKSDLLSKALEAGYSGYLMQHKYPFCVLNIKIDTSKIDVNVHPNKMDIRFSEQQTVFESIVKLVNEALSDKEFIPTAIFDKPQDVESVRTANKDRAPEPFEYNRIANETASMVREEAGYEANLQDLIQKRPDTKVPVNILNNLNPIHEKNNSNIIKEKDYIFVEKSEQLRIFDHEPKIIDQMSQYKILGQIFKTYWLIEHENALLMIDQHAAHEKIIYERLIKRLKSNEETLTQLLAPPIILHFSAKEYETYMSYKDYFDRLGFVVEEFGGEDYAIREIPLDLYGFDARSLFLEIIDELIEKPITDKPEVILDKIASMSCKAAVKGNNELTESEARSLIEQLMTLENPYHCPHGRPVIISMTQYELEKKFKRIVN